MKKAVKVTLAIIGIMLITGGNLFADGNVVQADEELPEWVTSERDVWVEEGIIYARGTARMSTTAMSTSTANSRARTNLSRALVNGEITDYAAIPTDTKTRTAFTYNGKLAEVGDLAVKDTFVDDDGYVYVLLSCTGAEV